MATVLQQDAYLQLARGYFKAVTLGAGTVEIDVELLGDILEYLDPKDGSPSRLHKAIDDLSNAEIDILFQEKPPSGETP